MMINIVLHDKIVLYSHLYMNCCTLRPIPFTDNALYNINIRFTDNAYYTLRLRKVEVY
jgi:hypothetical protein